MSPYPQRASLQWVLHNTSVLQFYSFTVGRMSTLQLVHQKARPLLCTMLVEILPELIKQNILSETSRVVLSLKLMHICLHLSFFFVFFVGCAIPRFVKLCSELGQEEPDLSEPDGNCIRSANSNIRMHSTDMSSFILAVCSSTIALACSDKDSRMPAWQNWISSAIACFRGASGS